MKSISSFSVIFFNRWRLRIGSFLLVFVCAVPSAVVYGAEALGELKIKDLHIRTTATHVDEGSSEFSLNDSSLTLLWIKNDELSAQIELGPQSNRNLPVYYAAASTEAVGIVTAFAEYNPYYGRFRAGAIPLNFGYEGQLPYYEKIFGGALFYTQRVFAYSDIGASFATEQNGFYTQFAVHNGEFDTAHDSKMWVSGNWGFSNERNFKTQLSLQTGTVAADLSTGANNDLGGVTNGLPAHWRNGLFFMQWHPRRWNVAVEVGGGEVDQNKYTGRYKTHLFELQREFDPHFTAGLRYNQMDPNNKVRDDAITEISLVMAFNSTDKSSVLAIQGTKVLEERNQVNNDQIRVSWLLTPYVH